VFTSSDLVFDGKAAPYGEKDPPSPLGVYGEQKVAAETGMKDRYPGVTVCRMPLMYGYGGPVATSFVQPWIRALKAGEPVRAFVDEYRTPVSGRQAAKGVMTALEKRPDILHLGGPERLSRFDFGRLLVEILHLPPDRLIPVRQSDLSMPAPRPADVSLKSTRAGRLGFAPAPAREELTKDRDLLMAQAGTQSNPKDA
jgi:dTDP-4-dehydrorhamnose reductase